MLFYVQVIAYLELEIDIKRSMLSIENLLSTILFSFSFLIDTSFGQVIGIDFGSAFNTATIVRLNFEKFQTEIILFLSIYLCLNLFLFV